MGELSNKKYNEAYKSCTGVVILNDNKFVYRVSGTMVDALSYNKIVFALKTPSFNYYKNNNKKIIHFFNDPMDLLKKIILQKNRNFNLDEDFKKFRFNNSSTKLKEDFSKIFTL